MRNRAATILGVHSAVVGMATVKYDKTRNKWQPHYHHDDLRRIQQIS